MKKLDLGQSLQLLGNAGVIVGILLLVYELSQNRAMMMAQARNSIAETAVNLRFETANSEALSRITLNGLQGEELTPLERLRWTNLWDANFRHWENVHYQYRVGLYEESEFLSQREAFTGILTRSETLLETFCSARGRVSAEFFAEMNDALGEARCK